MRPVAQYPDVTETRAAIERVLGQSLSSLTDGGRRSGRPGAQLAAWDLPDDALAALAAFGMPQARDDDLMGFVAAFQEGVLPEEERDGEQYYVLARCGSASIVALKGSGAVRSVSEPFEPHPQLAYLYPDGQRPGFINGSVPQLVECAWRYDRLLPLLVREQIRAGTAEVEAARAGRAANMPDFFEPYLELCRDVLERFRSIDPEIDPESGFWAETIIEVW